MGGTAMKFASIAVKAQINAGERYKFRVKLPHSRKALAFPLHGKRLHRPGHRQPYWLPFYEYCFHTIRRQQCHAQQPADVGRVDVFRLSDFLDGCEVTGFQQLAPAEASGQRLQQGAVDLHGI
jgi:hypothetical protein